MLDSLSQRLSKIVKTMRGQARLTEENTKDMLREVRIALLEADVALPVVREVLARIKEKAMGEEVVGNLNPGQALVGVVQRELTAIIGGDVPAAERDINLHTQPPAVILLAGLQGAGKTTMAGKLGAYCQKHFGKSPLLVACDVYRPAAIKQLQVVGEKLNLPVFEKGTQDPVITAQEAVEYAKRNMRDMVIVDTAGRLHIDSDMMAEIEKVRDAVNPAEILLVIDAMTGQDAVNAAKAFNDALELTGVIITKLDGDTRGGAALSVREVTGKPIKFCGNGEKLTDIEPFYPDRMASRILGMGDVMTLIEKAQESFDAKKAEELAKKIKTNEFTLEDFMQQMEQMQNMDMGSMLSMVPGMDAGKLGNVQIDEKQLKKTLAIIKSMTPKERAKPELLNASRRRRIAAGSGNSVQEVNRLLNQFESSRKLMKQLSSGKFGKKGKMRFPFGF